MNAHEHYLDHKSLHLHRLRIEAGQANPRDHELRAALDDGGFHWTGATYFKRLEDGSVRLRIFHPESHEQHAFWTWTDRTIDPASWASIVCSVSADGETGERHRLRPGRAGGLLT
jgi:hypothetical protein